MVNRLERCSLNDVLLLLRLLLTPVYLLQVAKQHSFAFCQFSQHKICTLSRWQTRGLARSEGICVFSCLLDEHELRSAVIKTLLWPQRDLFCWGESFSLTPTVSVDSGLVFSLTAVKQGDKDNVTRAPPICSSPLLFLSSPPSSSFPSLFLPTCFSSSPLLSPLPLILLPSLLLVHFNMNESWADFPRGETHKLETH